MKSTLSLRLPGRYARVIRGIRDATLEELHERARQKRYLVKLTDTHLVLSDPDQDIRNRQVIGRHGEEIGHVSDLFVDKLENKLRMLQVGDGRFLGLGDRHFLVLVDAVTSVFKDDVYIDQTRENDINSPVYDLALSEAPSRDSWRVTMATTAIHRAGAPPTRTLAINVIEGPSPAAARA